MFARAVRVGFLSLVLLLSACPRPPQPLLAGFSEAGAAERESLLAAVNARQDLVTTGRGMFHADARKGIVRQGLKQIVAFQRPSKLRIEFFASSLRQPAGLSVVNGGVLESFDPKENVLYRGEASLRNMERLFGLPFETDELTLWFTGTFPVAADEAQVLRDTRSGLLGVRAHASAARLIQATFDQVGESFRLRTLEVREEQSGALRFLSEFGYTDDEWPETIEFRLTDRELSAELRRESFHINPELPADRLFMVRVPDGAEIRLLE